MKKSLFIALVAMFAICCQAEAKYTKSISIFGDSYSTYAGYLQPDTNFVWYESQPGKWRNDVHKVTETWWHQLIKNNGYKLCVNNSFSGSTICNTGYVDKKTGKHQDYSDRSFATRLDNLGNPDIILVCGGTNDSWAGAPIGEYKYSDWTKEDLYSFRPAIIEFLCGKEDMNIHEMLNVLNKKSGVYGLSGDYSSDFRDLEDGYAIGEIIESEDRILL